MVKRGRERDIPNLQDSLNGMDSKFMDSEFKESESVLVVSVRFLERE